MMRALLVLVLLTACGRSSSDTSSSTAPDPTGTWVSNCMNDGTSSSQVSLVFDATNMVATTNNYLSTSCVNLGGVLRETMHYAVGIAVSALTNTYEVNYTEVKAEIAFKGDGVAMANNGKAFGRADWVDGNFVDVTGKTAGGAGSVTEPSLGDMTYSLIKIDGITLSTGDTSGANDGSTAAKRPTTLHTDVTYTKQ